MVTTPDIIEGVKEIVPMEGTTRERLLEFHRRAVKAAEAFWADTVAFETNTAIMEDREFSPVAFRRCVQEAKIEDGSIYAAMRDKLSFHRDAVLFLERTPA